MCNKDVHWYVNNCDMPQAKSLWLRVVFAGEVIRITDVKDFPVTFWLLSVICVAYYVTVFPFIGLGL